MPPTLTAWYIKAAIPSNAAATLSADMFSFRLPSSLRAIPVCATHFLRASSDCLLLVYPSCDSAAPIDSIVCDATLFPGRPLAELFTE